MNERLLVVEAPEVRYARSGAVNIAYQVLGDGPVDLLYIPGWISHLDLYWEEPAVSRFLRRVAAGFRASGASHALLTDEPQASPPHAAASGRTQH